MEAKASWLVIAKTCLSCGSELSVGGFDHFPTDEDVKMVEKTLKYADPRCCLSAKIIEVPSSQEIITEGGEWRPGKSRFKIEGNFLEKYNPGE